MTARATAGNRPTRYPQTRYPMDAFDGGRAADEPEHERISELGWIVRPSAAPDDDDVRALALAVMALTGGAAVDT